MLARKPQNEFNWICSGNFITNFEHTGHKNLAFLSISFWHVLLAWLIKKLQAKKLIKSQINYFKKATFFFERAYEDYKRTEAALQKCFWEKVFWKYAANIQDSTRAEVRFQ